MRRAEAMNLHLVEIAATGGRQDQGCTLTLFWADGTEDVGGSGGAESRGALGRVPRFAQRRVIFSSGRYEPHLCATKFYRVDADRLLTARLRPGARGSLWNGPPLLPAR